MTCFRSTSRQRRARTPVNASLKRSPAATALRCSVMRPTAELATRCALRSNSRGESVNERAKARGRMPCAARRFRGALPGIRARLCRTNVGTPPVARLHPASRQAVPGGGDLCGDEEASPGHKQSLRTVCAWRARGASGPGAACKASRRVGARSALRKLTRRGCSSAARKARVASSAARPCSEHRSGVCAKRRPAQCQPPPGTA